MALNIKARIKKAQENSRISEGLERIAELIDKGVGYDELTDEEKEIYCNYKKISRDSLEEIFYTIKGTLHIKITRNAKQPTKEESQAIYKDLQKRIEEYARIYNSPEEKAKREEWYKEVKRIGELRGEAFRRGEPMSNYPLPWENETDPKAARLREWREKH